MQTRIRRACCPPCTYACITPCARKRTPVHSWVGGLWKHLFTCTWVARLCARRVSPGGNSPNFSLHWGDNIVIKSNQIKSNEKTRQFYTRNDLSRIIIVLSSLYNHWEYLRIERRVRNVIYYYYYYKKETETCRREMRKKGWKGPKCSKVSRYSCSLLIIFDPSPVFRDKIRL